MKISVKKLFVFVMLLMLIYPITAVAETATKIVDVEIKSNGTHIFAIKWEQNDLDLELITPDGIEITKNNVGEYGTYKKNKDELKIQYIISSAKAGTWKMKLIKDKNMELGEVKADVAELKGVLTVEEFSVKQNEDETVIFNWKVTNSTDENVQISIGLDHDSTGYNGENLLSGVYKSEDTATIVLSNKSPDDYYFYIKVEDSEGILAYKYSKVIEVKNSQAPGSVDIYDLTTKNKTATVKWKPVDEEIEGYKVYYYIRDDQGARLLEENTVDKEITEYTSEFPFIDSDYRIGVTAYNADGLESKMTGKDLSFKKAQNLKLEVKWIEKNIINQKNIIIPIEIEKGSKVTAYHNGEAVIEAIEENGGVRFSLDEGMNNIEFEVVGKEGNKRTEERGYYLDTTPPQLSLYEDYAKKEIKHPIITIEGRVELGSILTINNNEVNYDENDGSFSYDLKLTRENKKLNILASDEAGNLSQYICDIHYSDISMYKKYIPSIILGVAAFIILAVYYIKKRKDGKNEN